MAFPDDIPTFESTAPGDPLSNPDHSVLHNAISTALTDVMGTLAAGVQGAFASVKARFEAIEADGWVTGDRIESRSVNADRLEFNSITSNELGTNSVNASEIAPGAVITSNLDDDAVTDAKTGAPSTGSLDSGRIRYARMGNMVSVWTTETPLNIVTLPAGFRPAVTLDVGAADITTAGLIRRNGEPAASFSVTFSTV